MWVKGLILGCAAGMAAIIYPTLEQRVIQPGDSAPSFSIKTDTGKNVTEKDFGGKVLVLNFWATWCRGCIEEFAALNEFSARNKGNGVVVVAVSVDKNENLYRRFLQSTRPAFETARDPEWNIGASYGTFLLPETYVIDSKGQVEKKFIGAIDNFPELDRLVKTL